MLAASNGTSAGNGGWGYESPNVVTYLSTWGQPGAIAWRCRAPRFGWPPVQHGLGKRLRLSGNVTFASRRMRRRWTMESHEASSRREVAPYGAMSKRLHSTRRGTRLDPGINWVRPAFLCSAKRGRFPALANLMPSIARSDGQCSRKRSRRPPPKMSSTVASTVLLQIGSRDGKAVSDLNHTKRQISALMLAERRNYIRIVRG